MVESAIAASCGCHTAPDARHLLPVAQAVEMAHALAGRIGKTELVVLADASGRVAARDLHAPRQMPFFDNSAMDGFAVRTQDFCGQGPWLLPVEGPVPAGREYLPHNTAKPAAVRIFTGAPVPAGFDAVVMQEYVEVSGAQARFNLLPRPGQNVRLAGEDVARGTLLVRAGTLLAPRHLGLLAANGYTAVNALVRPRVGVFSTGDELVEPGAEAKPSQLFDANRTLLLNLLRTTGAAVEDLKIVPDDLDQTTDFFTRHLGHYDLIVSSGAASVGGKDFIKPAFERAGGKTDFWKVAMKPGKPVMFGRGKGTVFAGLPGNSFAAYVGCKLFVEGIIAKLQGQPPAQFASARSVAGFSWERTTGRTEFFPVRRIGCDERGRCRLERLGHGGSASLFPLAQADGVGVVGAGVERVKPCDELMWHRFA